MAQGIVLWFNPIKGFGFAEIKKVSGADFAEIKGGEQIFLHYSNFFQDSDGDFFQKIKNLNTGDEISFEIVSGEKGLKAEKITYLER